MKNFKKWLIKKLGGYTEQVNARPKIVKLSDEGFSIHRIGMEVRSYGPSTERHIREQLALQLSNKLKEVLVIHPNCEHDGIISYIAYLSYVDEGMQPPPIGSYTKYYKSKGVTAMAYINKDNAIVTAIDACTEILGREITQFEAVRVAKIMEKIPDADVVTVELGSRFAVQMVLDEISNHRQKIGLDPIGFNPNADWLIDAIEYGCKSLRIARTHELEGEDENE